MVLTDILKDLSWNFNLVMNIYRCTRLEMRLHKGMPWPNQGNYKYFDLCLLTLLSTNWTYHNDWMYFLSKNNRICQFICLLSLLSLKFYSFWKNADFFFIYLCISFVLFDSFFSDKVTPFLKLSFIVDVGWKLLMLDAI